MLITIHFQDNETALACSIDECKLTDECHLIYKDRDYGIPVSVAGITEDEFIDKLTTI